MKTLIGVIVLLSAMGVHAEPQAENEELLKKRHYIRTYDVNADGKLSLEEFTEMTRVHLMKNNSAEDYKVVAEKRFAKTDANKDGFATPEEIVLQLVRVGYLPPEAAVGLTNQPPETAGSK